MFNILRPGPQDSAKDSSNGLPGCLIGSKPHEFNELGICDFCGVSFLEIGGWGRFNLRSCSNQTCRYIIAKLARKCPHCEEKQSKTFGVRLYRVYAFTCLPLIRRFTSSGEGGASPIDMSILLLGVIIGVFFGKAIRHQGSVTYQKMDIFFAVAISLMVLPTVFKDLVLHAKSPLIVRFGLCIQQGAFSDLLIEGIEKGIAVNGTSP